MSTLKTSLSRAASSSGLRQLISHWHLARWAPIPLRLIVGYGFIAHGLAKLEKGPERFADILDLLYLACLATLLLAGSGPLSVDNWMATRVRKQ